MVKYCIIFDKPVRLGLEVFEVIGPFDTTGQAMEFWAYLNRPAGIIRSIYTPTPDMIKDTP